MKPIFVAIACAFLLTAPAAAQVGVTPRMSVPEILHEFSTSRRAEAAGGFGAWASS